MSYLNSQKISRKLHLSKVKHSKFNESGQLLVFYLMSVLWSGDVIFRYALGVDIQVLSQWNLKFWVHLIIMLLFSFRENYVLNISSLWEGYPHNEMVFMFKFFFIVQLSYWLHCYPELYFQKTKREEMPARITYATLGLVYVLGAYLLK